MKELIDKAVCVGRQMTSPQTGLIHLNLEAPYAALHDKVPLFENALFALALMQTRNGENIQEGSELLMALFPFQSSGLFPKYLHEYGRHFSNETTAKLGLVFERIEKEFLHVLKKSVREQFNASYEALRAATRDIECPNIFCELSLRHLFQKGSAREPIPADLKQGNCFETYHALYAALLKSEDLKPPAAPDPFWLHHEPISPFRQGHHLFYLHFGDLLEGFSLVLERFKGAVTYSEHQDALELTFDYSHDIDPLDKVGDELSFYLTKKEGVDLEVGGERATLFQIDEPLWITGEGYRMEVQFSLEDDSDMFIGGISIANRASQRLDTLGEAYDWKISLRSLKRKKGSKLHCRIKWALFTPGSN